MAAQHWFAERFDALEAATEAEPPAKSESHIEEAVRAFSQPQMPEVWQHAFEETVSQTVHRLRNFLHQGKLDAYYFESDGRLTVPRDFWATAQANGVLESGTYWPFGAPSRVYEWRPNYALLLLQSKLDALLSEEPGRKRPLPRSKMPELVAALGKHDDLPNRAAQLQALRNLPEFREYRITTANFREAARRLPRDPGRKPRR